METDWYDLDPCGDMETNPTWYGADLVAAIRACRTKQEVGSHAFGHLIAGDPGCTAEAFRTDLAACRAVAETFERAISMSTATAVTDDTPAKPAAAT